MALTRKFLDGMGLEEKQVESIIEANAASIEGIKADRDKYKELAEKVPDLQKQLEEAKSASKSGGEWEKKYNDVQKAFDDFKKTIATEKADAEKAKAYRGMLAKAGIDPSVIDDIMAVTKLDGVEMEDGNLKGAEDLEKAAKEKWSRFVVKKVTKSEPPATPPKGGNVPEGADPEVAARMQARHERQFGKTQEKE